MPVVPASQPVVHEMHGATFNSYVSPSRGAQTLCAWRLDLAAGARGVPHRVSHEEVLLVLTGWLWVTLDGVPHEAGPGDVVVVPAGSELAVDCGPAASSAWVTTTAGLEAVTADGARIAPPWAR